MRTKPYTDRGLRRVRCSHCGKLPSWEQWTLDACADSNKGEQHGLCMDCDIKLNELLLNFFNIKDANKKIVAYRVKMTLKNHG